jgi:PAB-dependent poly(A)-specific ribonuclease subunit 2
VRSFQLEYKEPCLIVFRALDSLTYTTTSAASGDDESSNVTIPPDIMASSSITNSGKSPHVVLQRPAALPGPGELVAFDAEFVAVAEEEAILTPTGSKLTIRETRHALARISILDGRPATMGRIILDDHVQPNETVTDYLTRFSGIVARDLSSKHSRQHLITARTAYLKLRCLVERGCIFVGHGLRQDFWTANLAVPASQIIDTVDIYHKPALRYISLRFLTNFLLKRDMQQDVHNSVEDAAAAWILYRRALELKQKGGEFGRVLDELYDYGQKCDWKLGVDNDDDADK